MFSLLHFRKKTLVDRFFKLIIIELLLLGLNYFPVYFAPRKMVSLSGLDAISAFLFQISFCFCCYWHLKKFCFVFLNFLTKKRFIQNLTEQTRFVFDSPSFDAVIRLPTQLGQFKKSKVCSNWNRFQTSWIYRIK